MFRSPFYILVKGAKCRIPSGLCFSYIILHFGNMYMLVLNLSTFYLLIYCNILTHVEKIKRIHCDCFIHMCIHTYIYHVLLLLIFSSLSCSSLALCSSLRYSTFCLYLLFYFFISAYYRIHAILIFLYLDFFQP